jgi:hypothetical protein
LLYSCSVSSQTWPVVSVACPAEVDRGEPEEWAALPAAALVGVAPVKWGAVRVGRCEDKA